MRTKLSILTVSALFVLSAFAILPIGVLGSTVDFDPNAEGHELDWTAKGAGDHYVEVDDGNGTHDDDTSYVSVTSGNQEDYWNLVDHTSESGTITNVRLSLRVKHDGGAGGEEFAFALANQWNAEYVGTDVATDTTWTTYTEDHATHPVDSVAWNWTAIDNLQLGIKSRAIGGYTGTGMCTSGWITVTYTAGAAASLTVTLRKSNNVQERIDVGTFGNMTVTPGGTNQNSTNFVRAQCDNCDGVDDSFWVNWSGTTWESAKTGDSIDIDGNYRLYFYETTSGTADPDDGGWSWSDSGVDADGDYQITFTNSGTTYVWVRYRIEAIPSPLSGSDDYQRTYTTELDR